MFNVKCPKKEAGAFKGDPARRYKLYHQNNINPHNLSSPYIKYSSRLRKVGVRPANRFNLKKMKDHKSRPERLGKILPLVMADIQKRHKRNSEVKKKASIK